VAAVRANSAALDIDARATIADRTAAALDAYIAHLVEDARALADVPAVRAEAAAAREDVTRAEAAALDQQWKARRTIAAPSGIDALIGRILSRPVSKYFSDICNNKAGVFREILLTDREGDLVAASGATEDYEQQDELWWKQAIGRSRSCATARDCAYGGDVEFDSSVGANAFEVAVPVFEDGGELAGVLKVVIDPRELPLLLTLARASHPVTVTLIRRNGTDVLEPGSPFADGVVNDAREVPESVRRDLESLGGDQQIAIDLGGETVPVRALAGPQFERWGIAVRDRSDRALDSWIQHAALVAIIVVMFLLSARTYARLFHRPVQGA
jgi:hypothetical protein